MTAPPSQPAIPQNAWDRIPVPELGSWTPSKTVSVVIPAYDAAEELPLTLAALGAQTYPADLLDVVVVDDGNEPSLEVPTSVGEVAIKALRVDAAEKVGFGAGQARARGAQAATGELLLFLDADIVADPEHVEAHARWHHVIDYAATLGTRTFVDVGGISAEALASASAAGEGLGALVADREQQDHDWIEEMLAETDELREPRADLWRVGVGSSIGMPAALYHACGGYPAFGVRGIEDVTFGYRLFTAGAVLVPDRAAHCWHQGERFLSDAASKKAAQRTRRPYAANNLPYRAHRKPKPGRSYTVPTLVVEVPLDAASTAKPEALACVEALLASDTADAAIGMTAPQGDPVRERLALWMAGQERVVVTDAATWAKAHPLSPVRVSVPPATLVGPTTLSRLWAELEEYRVGAVRAAEGEPPLRAVATRALRRAERLATDPREVDHLIATLFGEVERSAAELDLDGAGAPAPPGAGSHRDAEVAALEAQVEALRARRAVRLAEAFGALRRARRPREIGGALRRIGRALGPNPRGPVA